MASAAVRIAMPSTRGVPAIGSGQTEEESRDPRTYFIEEKDLGDARRYHHQIVLTEDTGENRRVREGRAPGREGPVAIMIDIHQNGPQRQCWEEWIRTHPESNFRFSSRRLPPSPITGTESLLYTWPGLYEADAIAVAAAGHLYVFTVTYIAPEDPIRRDFYDIFRTVRFG